MKLINEEKYGYRFIKFSISLFILSYLLSFIQLKSLKSSNL